MEKLRVMGGQEHARLAVEVPVRRTTMLMTFRPFFHRPEEGSNTLVRAWQESAIRGFLAGTKCCTIRMLCASSSLMIHRASQCGLPFVPLLACTECCAVADGERFHFAYGSAEQVQGELPFAANCCRPAEQAQCELPLAAIRCHPLPSAAVQLSKPNASCRSLPVDAVQLSKPNASCHSLSFAAIRCHSLPSM